MKTPIKSPPPPEHSPTGRPGGGENATPLGGEGDTTMSSPDDQLRELLTKAFPQGFAIVGAEQHVLEYVKFMRRAGYDVRAEKGAKSLRLSLFVGSFVAGGDGVQIVRDIDLKYLIHTPRPEAVETTVTLFMADYSKAVAEAEAHGFNRPV